MFGQSTSNVPARSLDSAAARPSARNPSDAMPIHITVQGNSGQGPSRNVAIV
jgi:hypothetical protein